MAKSRYLRIRGVRNDPPDIKKLSRAIILLAQAQAEADAAAQDHGAQSKSDAGETKPQRPRGAA